MKKALLLAPLLIALAHAQADKKWRIFEAKEVKALGHVSVFHNDPAVAVDSLKQSFTWNGDSKEEQEKKLAAMPAGGTVDISIGAKTRAASHGTNFDVTVIDAKGKEVAKGTGPDKHGEPMPKFAGGGGYQLLFEVQLKADPEFPITVKVLDKLAKKEAEWKITEKK